MPVGSCQKVDQVWKAYTKSRIGLVLALTSSRSRLPIFTDQVFSSKEATFGVIGTLLDHVSDIDQAWKGYIKSRIGLVLALTS